MDEFGDWMGVVKIFFIGVEDGGALKTAPWLLLSLIEVGDFFGKFGLENGGLFFVFWDFGVEFVESFASGSKDGDGHERKVFKNLFLFLKFDYILFRAFNEFFVYFAYSFN